MKHIMQLRNMIKIKISVTKSERDEIIPRNFRSAKCYITAPPTFGMTR